MSNRPDISVLLCTYRPCPSLVQPFKSLMEQDFEDFEIVLVEQDVNVRKCIPKDINITLKQVKIDSDGHYRPLRARNAGLEKCRGQLVFIMHDFAYLQGADYLSRLWDASLQARRAVATRKIVHVIGSPGQLDKSTGLHLSEDSSLDVTGFYCHQDAVPLRYLKQVKGFDEIYDDNHGYDDYDLKMRLEKVGCSVIEVPGLVSHKVGTRMLWPLKNDDTGVRGHEILVSRYGPII